MEFKKYRLGEIATFSQGKQVDVKEQYATKRKDMKKFTRIVDYTNASEPVRYVENYGDRYFASEDELVMIRYGSQTAGMAVMGKNGIIANNLFKINLDNDIVLNKYMYYYLSQKEIFNYLRSSQSSSTMPAISFSIMNSLEIDIPSISYQKKSINILQKIDRKIELNNQINDNLYSLIDSLYKDGILDKYEKNHKLLELYNFQYGKGNNNPDNNGIYPVYGSNGIIGGYTEFNNEEAPVIGHIGANCGSLIFAFGKHFVTYNGVMCMIKNEDFKYFGYVTMRFLNFRNEIRGSSQPFVSYDLLDNMNIPLPENEIIKKYEKLFKPLFKIINNNLNQNKNLEQLRDTLLPKLMNGEIDLDKIEI